MKGLVRSMARRGRPVDTRGHTSVGRLAISVGLPPTDCPAGVPLAPGPSRPSRADRLGGDGGPATDAGDRRDSRGSGGRCDGAVYFVGRPTAQGVRRIDLDGIITSCAGSDGQPPFISRAGSPSMPPGTCSWRTPAHHVWRSTPPGRSSIAGTGAEGSTGDGGPAVDAPLHPFHLSGRPGGEVYFDDVPRYRVIDPDGIVHPFAGTTTPGFAGDGGPAVAALLGGADPRHDIEGIAVAADGSVYLADNANSRIRRVDPAGIITTVAGQRRAGLHGRRRPGLGGDLPGPGRPGIRRCRRPLRLGPPQRRRAQGRPERDHHDRGRGRHAQGASGDCGPATEASIQPWAIAVHDGYLYIGDMANSRIRVVKL